MEWTLEQIEDLRESVDLEVKLALGANGQGALPKGIWETYSAFANTQGGFILLGVKESPDGTLIAVGIPNADALVKSLWDGLHNPQKVSANLLSDSDVTVSDTGGKKIICIQVPKASRTQRPVFINSNPISGTFRRSHEGDYRCSEETVRRMLAEQVEDARDTRILTGYDLNDFDLESLKRYRNQFEGRQPDHPWNRCDMREFLRNIGAWSVDRANGSSAPTVAGILMFGTLRSILDALPNYVVDYQEWPLGRTDQRWIDRLTTDGTWSGNLYDFYCQVILKLYIGLKVPFQLKGAERVEETPVHVALREALINTLIHADYSGRVSTRIVKSPDFFGFWNPGGLRIPLAEAKRGGLSDCRNRNLQKMFQLLGAGEQAGSGIPKIYTGWSSQHWRNPEFTENISADREETVLHLRMASLLPEETVKELGNRFGDPFYELSGTHRMALVTAALEGSLTHARLLEMGSQHPRDISSVLHDLTQRGMLESDGTGRGTYYFLPGQHPAGNALSLDDQEDHTILEVQHNGTEVQHSETEVQHNEAEVQHSETEVQHSETEVQHNGTEVQHNRLLEELAAPIAHAKRTKPEIIESIIVALCRVQEMSSQKIAALLHRNEQTIQNHYLNPMCDKGLLIPKYPVKHHPKQQYRATS